MSEAGPGPSSDVPGGADRPARQRRPSGDSLRWQPFFQRCDEALFVLNRRRRVLFVNRAWEELAGLSAADAHYLVCTRAKPGNLGDPLEEILAHALCPPPDVLQGRGGRTRRLLPGWPASRRWWDVDFFPFHEGGRLLGILGRVTPVDSEEPPGAAPLPEKLAALRERVAGRSSFDLLASDLPAMRRLAEQVRLASQVGVPVLLVGEPGTGKRTLARVIHFQGPRRDRAFAALDCARLPASAVAGWLLGSNAAARGPAATVYLAEPAALPRDLQLRLCELLSQPCEPGAAGPPRIVTGCAEPPEPQVRSGKMLEDLACALGALVLPVPPLRQRQADLPQLVERILDRVNVEDGPRVVGLTVAAWELVRGYPWPGNLRELVAVLASARTRARGERIDAADLPATLAAAQKMKDTPGRRSGPPLPLDQLLEQAERRLLELALRQAKGKKVRAAELLGIWRQRLVRRMQALGIADPEGGTDDGADQP
jgi:transcriptional regulator with PAS, ATPase and Fis domain